MEGGDVTLLRGSSYFYIIISLFAHTHNLPYPNSSRVFFRLGYFLQRYTVMVQPRKHRFDPLKRPGNIFSDLGHEIEDKSVI